MTTLPIERVHPNPAQPRKVFERAPLEELADSIRSLGVIEPIIAMPDADGWMIVAGERRWRAARMAGLETIPAIVRDDLTPTEAFEISMVENVLRRDMNPMEEAEGYRTLLEAGMDTAQVARRLGKKEAAIKAALTLLGLEPGIRDLVAKRHLTAWDGTRLATLSWNGQTRALDLIQRHGLTGNDRDRVVGQVWRSEHEEPMFGDAEARLADPVARNATAELRSSMETAMRALTRATELLEATPDPLTVELAEAVMKAAGIVARQTRRAEARRLVMAG